MLLFFRLTLKSFIFTKLCLLNVTSFEFRSNVRVYMKERNYRNINRNITVYMALSRLLVVNIHGEIMIWFNIFEWSL